MDFIIWALVIGAVGGIIAGVLSVIAGRKNRKRSAAELSSQGFNITKEIGDLKLNEPEKKWCIISDFGKSKIYNYSDVNDFELVEDGEKYKSKGGILRSVVGGVTFGAVGAIVGASTAQRTTTINSMYITIYTKKGDLEKIDLITTTTKKDSALYRLSKLNAENIMAMLSAMKGNTFESEPENDSRPGTISSADEIRKYKQLLDDGIISAEEFEEKKKQLLNS